jgi:hypothetical protein
MEAHYHMILKAFPASDGKVLFDAPVVLDPEGSEYHLCFSRPEYYNAFLAQAYIHEDPILARYNRNIEELVTHALPISLIVDIFPVPNLLVDPSYQDMQNIRHGEPPESGEHEDSLVGESGPVRIRRFVPRDPAP